MFEDLLGNVGVRTVLQRMIAQERVPRSLIFSGPEGIGKKLFALELARGLNCRNVSGGNPCGNCPVCTRITTINYPTADDRESRIAIVWTGFPDIGLIQPPGRFILVDQIRRIEREANFRPFEGKARVFIIEAAECLNDASSNALLKTLEEPATSTHLILITSKPGALLTTIRSRCQEIRFSPLTPGEIFDFLARRNQHPESDMRLISHAAEGSIADALSLDPETFRENRREMVGILSFLTLSGDTAKLLRGSELLNDAKHKDDYEANLNMLASLIHDLWLLAARDDLMSLTHPDLKTELQKMATGLNPTVLAGWLRQIDRHQRLLNVNINRKVSTDALFLSMAESRNEAKALAHNR